MAKKPTAHAASDGLETCTIELHVHGTWHVAGTVTVDRTARGISSPGRFEYDYGYLGVMESAFHARDARAVSCRHPVSYETFDETRWPPFLLDIVPSGAARRYWEEKLGLPSTEGERNDWPALKLGAAHPPGNLRVSEAKEHYDGPAEHPGFERAEILERADKFIEYAHQCGAPISGSSGAGGDSPKFLLREDVNGRWHADGALADDRTRCCWLVKFPRTPDQSDKIILEAEAAYHRVARRMGIRTWGDVTWERNCLFVPRFDRVVADGGITYLGLESLCSLAGVAEFGARPRKEVLARALAAYATDRAGELRELLLRDVLDVALGNTDNHARNTSVLKDANGGIKLSPLYDLAPMIMDARGIARVCRWADGEDYPNWTRAMASLAPLGLDAIQTARWLRERADEVADLPQTMHDCGVPQIVIERCSERIERTARALAKVTA